MKQRFRYVLIVLSVFITLCSCSNNLSNPKILPKTLEQNSIFIKNSLANNKIQLCESDDSRYKFVKYFEEPIWSFETGTTVFGLYKNNKLVAERFLGESSFSAQIVWLSKSELLIIHFPQDEETYKLLVNETQTMDFRWLTNDVAITNKYIYWPEIISLLYNKSYLSNSKMTDFYKCGEGISQDSLTYFEYMNRYEKSLFKIQFHSSNNVSVYMDKALLYKGKVIDLK